MTPKQVNTACNKNIEIGMHEILDVIHKTIYQFFDVCSDDEEVPISKKDKLLLSVNKAICNNLKALEPDTKTGHWIDSHCDCCGKVAPFHIGRCGGNAYTEAYYSNYCPNCGAKMKG